MNHPDWPAFLAAICAEPDDDTPRLVAADFLEENGDPDRAAFVRAQVELARLEAAGLKKSPEAHAARSCEQKYLGPTTDRAWAWAVEDCPALGGVVPPAPAGTPRAQRAGWLQYRRGFVEHIDCAGVAWLRHGAEVRERIPVRDLFLTDCEHVSFDEWEARADALRGLRTVEVFCPITRNEANVAEWLRPLLPGTRVTFLPF